MKASFLFTALTLTSLTAGELTIQSAPFETTLELEATFLPSEAVNFQLDPKQWSQFVIADLVDHGRQVKEGDVIISFEKEDYLRQLEETKAAAKTRDIELAKTERELADLRITTPHELEGLKLAHDRAKEALDYFKETGKDLKIEDANQSLERAQRSLRYQEEELEQLLKMYEEDGITEETEEIILTRQKASVDSARFNLKKMELATQWTLEKSIPREAVDLQREFDQALVAFETGTVNLPRTLSAKTLAVAKAQRADAKADQDLVDLEADGRFLTLTAPSDGIIYYGEIADGTWSLGNTSKFLFEGGTAPVETTLMALVPTDAPLVLHGEVPQSDYLSLSSEAEGRATVAGLSGTSFPVTLSQLDAAPNQAGKYGLKMSVTLPDESPLVAGMKAKVELVTYRNAEAITLPDEALSTIDGKTTVKLKMADGKHETREVKTGRKLDGKTEILEGLEVDQVILLPEPSAAE